MNFIFRYFLRKHIEPEREAYFYAGLASKWGFDLFNDNDFRQKIEFNKLETIEQDRIFNELAVTTLIYVIVLIDDKLKQDQIPDSRWEFWRDVRDSIAPMYLIMISSYKVPQQYVDMWGELIEMRLEEYYQRRKEAYNIWDQAGPEEKNELKKDTWIGLEALRISAMLHLTRGKAEPDDPLKKVLQSWLIGFHNKLMKRIGW